MYYKKNTHNSSSRNNLPTQQAKRDNRKDPSEYKTLGAQTGHKGTSHHRKPTETKLYNDDNLMELYHIAKGRLPGDISDLISRTLDIADHHER